MEQYVDFGGLLFSMLQKKPAAADIERIVKEAVAVEKAFILEVSQPSQCVTNLGQSPRNSRLWRRIQKLHSVARTRIRDVCWCVPNRSSRPMCWESMQSS
jgi:hypothetical protein